MNAIKVNNNIKAQTNQKLKDTITNLTNEKNDLKNKNDILAKRIEDLDKEKIRSKSLPKKKVLSKPKVFKNLKKVNVNKFIINKSDIKKDNKTNITNKNKNINKNKNKDTNKNKNTKKKFEKLNITKNAVNVLIIPKNKKINKNNKEKKEVKKEDKKEEKKEQKKNNENVNPVKNNNFINPEIKKI